LFEYVVAAAELLDVRAEEFLGGVMQWRAAVYSVLE
jgi:hypothetical protein